jgi:hypothetical protein
MNRRDIAFAAIRRQVEESGELTVFALRTAQEHRIGYAAMMAAAREGLRRRKLVTEGFALPHTLRLSMLPHPQPALRTATRWLR